MKKFFAHYFKIIFICFFLINFNLQTFAIYSFPEEKSIFLRDKKLDLNNIIFTSNNKNIVTVSNEGIALGLKSGSATVTAKKNNDLIASYDLKVTEPEDVKQIFIEPNNPSKNSQITLFAITNKDVNKVKFIINANNKLSEIISTTKDIDSNNFIYFSNFKVPDCNEFYIEVDYYKNNLLKKSSIKKKKIIVSKDSSYGDINLNLKRISTNCVNFITSYEGFKSEISRDPIGKDETFDIGYGKVVNFGKSFYNKMTKKEAYADFLNEINNSKYTDSVNNFLISNNIMFNQHQFDALVSFTYNLGINWMKNSTLKNIILNCKNLNNIDKDKFIKDFLSYHHCGKKCYKGLLYRRIDELEIFFFNDYKKDGNLNKNKFSIPECIINTYGRLI